MKIAFAYDHAGFSLREAVWNYLTKKGHHVLDFWPKDLDPLDDFPDYAHPVCQSLIREETERGVLICGTGIGMSIAANRHKSIRAVIGFTEEIVRTSRSHNDANIICFWSRTQTLEDILVFLDIFLAEKFLAEKYERRNKKVDSYC